LPIPVLVTKNVAFDDCAHAGWTAALVSVAAVMTGKQAREIILARVGIESSHALSTGSPTSRLGQTSTRIERYYSG
jgi:hypothetical protein